MTNLIAAHGMGGRRLRDSRWMMTGTETLAIPATTSHGAMKTIAIVISRLDVV